MKKILLVFVFLLSFTSYAQDYWTEYATGQPTTSTGVASISIVDPNIVWLSMQCGTTGCTKIRQYAKSVDHGANFTSGIVDLGASSASLQISNIHGVSTDVAFAGVFPQNATALGGIWKTIDGGTTWTKQITATFSDANSFVDFVYFWDANNGVALGDPIGGYYEVYTTTDGGTTWVRTPSQPALVVDATLDQEYGLTDQFTFRGNSIWAGTTNGRILKSTDKGYTWSVVQSPITDFGGGLHGTISGDMAFIDEQNGLLQTSDYQLFNTTDGGATWNAVTYSGPIRNFGIAAIPGTPNTYVSIGEDLDTTTRGSSYSIDGGLTWTSINDNPDLSYVQGSKISFLDINTGYAGGFSASLVAGGIYVWDPATYLTTSTFSYDKSVRVSPNPSNGIVNINGKNISQVIVTDLLGKVIATSNYSALNNVDLDLSSLNSGVYMVKVTSEGSSSSVVKVIKK